LLVGAAVGTKGDYLDRAALMVEHGADLLLVDVAHGHSDQVIDTVGKLHARHPRVPIVAGNVATAGGTNDLLDAGADVVKVGIGPGGVCTTRLVAGSGVPQLTAIIDCAHAAAQRDATVIADGGVRQSGDLAKALAAGAAAVMLGSALAGADESEAGVVDLPDGSRYRCSRGFATLGMANTLRAAAGGRLTRDDVVGYIPEGVEMTFAPSGPVADTVYQLVGGLRSAMSYTGAADMAEFRRLAEFIRVTPAGRAENAPHAAERAPQPAPDFRAEAVAQI
jgi:IMP dehydrogenase/GMP reductase